MLLTGILLNAIICKRISKIIENIIGKESNTTLFIVFVMKYIMIVICNNLYKCTRFNVT